MMAFWMNFLISKVCFKNLAESNGIQLLVWKQKKTSSVTLEEKWGHSVVTPSNSALSKAATHFLGCGTIFVEQIVYLITIFINPLWVQGCHDLEDEALVHWWLLFSNLLCFLFASNVVSWFKDLDICDSNGLDICDFAQCGCTSEVRAPRNCREEQISESNVGIWFIQNLV